MKLLLLLSLVLAEECRVNRRLSVDVFHDGPAPWMEPASQELVRVHGLSLRVTRFPAANATTLASYARGRDFMLARLAFADDPAPAVFGGACSEAAYALARPTAASVVEVVKRLAGFMPLRCEYASKTLARCGMPKRLCKEYRVKSTCKRMGCRWKGRCVRGT